MPLLSGPSPTTSGPLPQRLTGPLPPAGCVALAALLHDATLTYVGKGVKREAQGALLLVVKDDGSVVVHGLRKGTSPDFWMSGPKPKVWTVEGRLLLEVGRPGGQCLRLEGTPAWTHRVDDAPFEAAESEAPPEAGSEIAWSEEKAPSEAPLSEEEEARFRALREWRLGVARERAISAFIVAPDRSLREIARRKPGTPEALRGVPGMGEARVERYGEDILRVLRAA